MSIPVPCSGISRRVLADLEDAGHKSRDIARWLGCDESQLSHYRSGARAMKAWEMERLVARVGAPLVLRELAAIGDCDVVPRALSSGHGDARVLALDVSVGAAQLTREVHAALADGLCTDAEADDIERRVNQLVSELHRLRARARAS